MKELLVLIKKDILEQVRSKKLLIIFVTFLFVAVSSPALAKLTPLLLKSIPSTPGLIIKLPEPTYKDAIDQFVKNISQIGILVLLFISAGAIVDEKIRKNLEILLTKPVSRTKFILSKFITYNGTIGITYIIFSLVFYFYTVSLFATFNFTNFVIVALNILAYIVMIIAITLFASTFTKNSISAAGIGFISFILFGSIFNLFDWAKKYSPNFIFSNYKDIIVNGWNNDLITPLLAIVLVILVSVLFAILVFQKQEIER